MVEEVARARDVVDDIRVICDECLTVARAKHLETLDYGFELCLALECHDGARIAVMPTFLVRAKQAIHGEARRPWSILRCEIKLLTHEEIDALIQRVEADLNRSGEVLAELEKAMGRR